MNSSRQQHPSQEPASGFGTTQWSLVLRGGRGGNQESDEALGELCQRYWFPLYSFVRRRVGNVADAQDLTQAFFAFLLEKNVLASASPDRGRFRSFLLASFKNFQTNEWDRANARKRGGGVKHLSLAFDAGESRLALELAHTMTPERLFERQWALTLLDFVVGKLQAEFTAAGKARQFELLKGALTGDRHARLYAAHATDLGMSEEAARQAAHRLRKRFRELLRKEVAHTVDDPAEVDDEINRLFQALGS